MKAFGINEPPVAGICALSSRTESELKLELKRSKYTKRYLVALLVCVGQINMQLLRSSLPIAMVEMTSNKTIYMKNETTVREAEFDWDSKTKGIVLSLFFYGYLASPLGGEIAQKFGGGLTFGLGILSTAVLTLISPFCLRRSFASFIVLRVLKGVSQAVANSSVSDIYFKWARPEERSKFVSIGFMGAYIGITMAFPFCGYLAHTYDWTMVFYGTGMLGLFWGFMWFMIVTNEPPSDNHRPSKILQSYTPQESVNPWKRIVKSKACWALNIGKTAYALGYAFVVLCFPLYLKDITNADTHTIGILSGIPNFISIFIVPVIGVTSDFLINKKILNTTRLHKLFMCTSLAISGIILILITFVSNFVLIMVGFVIFKVILGFSFFVTQMMPITVAPKYSSLVTGMSTFWYTLMMIVCPIFVGFIVTDHDSYQWAICFYSGSLVMFIGAIIFFIWASSEAQPWAVLNEKHTSGLKTTEKTVLG